MSKQGINIHHVERPLDIASFDDNSWDSAEPVIIDRYWSSGPTPEGRVPTVRMLWSDDELYVRFDTPQTEPLVVNDAPDLSQKTVGLWERDVCEIFIAPDTEVPNKYFEFEIAPTGEWLDLAIEIAGKERVTDWDYRSNMTASARIEEKSVVMTIAIPFASLGKTPAAGDVWRGNLFRCVGSGDSRGYLAWQPTFTATPNFHVPDAFGEFLFI